MNGHENVLRVCAESVAPLSGFEPWPRDVNPNQAGGGQICPTVFQTLIPLEPNVGLTSNQAVNSSLFVVLWSLKKIDQFGPFEDHGGPF